MNGTTGCKVSEVNKVKVIWIFRMITAFFIAIGAFKAMTFIKPAIMPSIDSGSFDFINLPPGFKIDIFADEPGGSPVLNKSHSLDFL
jgi:hypothetical protein